MQRQDFFSEARAPAPPNSAHNLATLERTVTSSTKGGRTPSIFCYVILLHVLPFVFIYSWHTCQSHEQLQDTHPIVKAYIASTSAIDQVLPSKTGLLKTHPKQKNKSQAHISHSKHHWPKLTNEQIHSILLQLNQLIDQAILKLQWPLKLNQHIVTRFTLSPKNQIQDIHFVNLNGTSQTAIKLKKLLTDLPPLQTNINHGPLSIELPIQISQNSGVYNPMDNL